MRVTVTKQITDELKKENLQYIMDIFEKSKAILAWEENVVVVLPDKENINDIKFIARVSVEFLKYGGCRINLPKNVSANPEGLVTYLEEGMIKIRRGL